MQRRTEEAAARRKLPAIITAAPRSRNGHGSPRCCQRLLQPTRQLERGESLARVEVVLARLIDDAEEPIALGRGVPQRDVDLPPLKRRLASNSEHGVGVHRLDIIWCKTYT